MQLDFVSFHRQTGRGRASPLRLKSRHAHGREGAGCVCFRPTDRPTDTFVWPCLPAKNSRELLQPSSHPANGRNNGMAGVAVALPNYSTGLARRRPRPVVCNPITNASPDPFPQIRSPSPSRLMVFSRVRVRVRVHANQPNKASFRGMKSVG